ncbi:MAG: AMP-binding protein, partial [Chloroflexota bacterium]|nr:AMP-binding protein [Chloroflexota bacterium]
MIWPSPYADVSIPDVSLSQLVLERAAKRGDKPALIDGSTGRVVTNRQFHDRVYLVAASLSRRGFEKGTVLAVYSPNTPEYAIVLYAVALLGGVSTTANPLLTAGELTTQLADAGAVYLVTVPVLLDTAAEAAKRAGRIREIIVFGEAPGATPFDSLLEEGGPVPQVAIDPKEDLAALPYSSGTTGLNKGVMLTHRNLVANLCQIEPYNIITEQDTILGLLPFYHIYGMVCTLHGALYVGATVVTMPRFDLDSFLETLERYRITVAQLVPPIILALAKHPSVAGYDLFSLRLINSGAAPLDSELAGAAGERLGCLVTQGYGLTETSPVTHFNPTGTPAGSVGPPVPNTECRIVDPDTGAALRSIEEGEILIRGPQVMKGYLNDPEATARTLDPNGWLHTGDLGYADEEGRFYIVDRIKELIKYKGYQVAPAELEAVLLSHP